MQYLILSNNSCLEGTLKNIPIKYLPVGLAEFHAALSEALQNGYELISSPLPPNVPLIRSPIRSVILRKAERKYNAKGLLAVEKAMERTKVLGINMDARICKDLQFIDRDHLLRALAQLEELSG